MINKTDMTIYDIMLHNTRLWEWRGENSVHNVKFNCMCPMFKISPLLPNHSKQLIPKGINKRHKIMNLWPEQYIAMARFPVRDFSIAKI